MNILEVSNLSVNYLAQDGAVLKAVESVSFQLEEGRTLGLVGESGCGKTTIARSLMRLLPEEGRIVDGKILLNGRDLLRVSEEDMRQTRWQEIAMIFQGAMNALNPVRTVEAQIIEALRHNGITERHVLHQRCSELLERVGIPAERGKQYPHQYSGGMRQRAVIAMALACNPSVLIADEPTTALDVMIQAQILDLLEQLKNDLALSMILVTHDLGLVAETCDDVLVMYGGVVAEYASIDAIYNNPRHPYTQRLLQAFPDVEKPDMELVSIPGSPPRLNDLPPGCRFGPRCHLREDICLRLAPNISMISPQHLAACHLIGRGQ